MSRTVALLIRAPGACPEVEAGWTGFRQGLEARLAGALDRAVTVRDDILARAETATARRLADAGRAEAACAIAVVCPRLLATEAALETLARFRRPGSVLAIGRGAGPAALPRPLATARWFSPGPADRPTAALADAVADAVAGALARQEAEARDRAAGRAILERQQASRRARAEARSLSPPDVADVEARLEAERAVERNLEIGRRAVQAEVRRRTDPAGWHDRGRARFPRPGQGEWSVAAMILLAFLTLLAPFGLYFGVTALFAS